jgi:hypothetical protein
MEEPSPPAAQPLPAAPSATPFPAVPPAAPFAVPPEAGVGRLPGRAVGDAERGGAAAMLQRACGQGHLTLEEFSVRVGAVWAADTEAELARATAGVAPPVPAPTQLPVPRYTARPVSKIVTVFSETTRTGRWKLPAAVHLRTVFGETNLDLRAAVVDSGTVAEGFVEVTGTCVFGAVKITVPEGVEVEFDGASAFSSRKINLTELPRHPGTPVVRINLNCYFGEVKVRSAPPGAAGNLPRWLRELFGTR